MVRHGNCSQDPQCSSHVAGSKVHVFFRRNKVHGLFAWSGFKDELRTWCSETVWVGIHGSVVNWKTVLVQGRERPLSTGIR